MRSLVYSAKRATVSTRPRFFTNFLKINFMVVQERRGNLKSRSRVNFKLSEKPRPSIKQVSEKCQKSLSGGNGSALRAVRVSLFHENTTILCMFFPQVKYLTCYILLNHMKGKHFCLTTKCPTLDIKIKDCINPPSKTSIFNVHHI